MINKFPEVFQPTNLYSVHNRPSLATNLRQILLHAPILIPGDSF